MLFLTRGGSVWRKTATAATATALAATTLAFASAPAQADEAAAPVLNWNISQNFINHFTANYGPAGGSIAATGGATFEAGALTFAPNGATKVAGETTLSYAGSVTGTFQNGGVPQYTITVAAPEIEFDATGAGEIRATLSSTVGTEQTSAPAEVVVAEFSGGTSSDTTFAVTPDFAGVLPANSAEAVALEIGADQPVDGKAFHPDFLGHLPSSLRGHFYASISQMSGLPAAANVNKPVAAIDATYKLSPPSVTTSAAISGDYLNLTAVLNNINPDPNAVRVLDGIYVSVSEKRDIFNLPEGQEAGTAAMLTTNHIPASSIVNGSVTTQLKVLKSKFKKGTQYAIYTWTAHGNPNPIDTQYGETLISIPAAVFPVVKVASKTTVKVNKVPTTKKAGKATIKVTGKQGAATGKVTFKLKKGKATKKVKAAKLNKNGKAVVKLPKLKKGKWKLTATYTGNANYKASKKTVTVRVKR